MYVGWLNYLCLGKFLPINNIYLGWRNWVRSVRNCAPTILRNVQLRPVFICKSSFENPSKIG